MNSLGSHETPIAYLEDQFTFENDAGKSEILVSAMIKMRTLDSALYAELGQFIKLPVGNCP